MLKKEVSNSRIATDTLFLCYNERKIKGEQENDE